MFLVDFSVQFPEFNGSPTGMIQAYLDSALLEMDLSLWGPTGGPVSGTGATAPGTRADQAQGYLAAHKLTMSPFGMNARLIMKDGSTTYWKHFTRLQYIAVAGHGTVA